MKLKHLHISLLCAAIAGCSATPTPRNVDDFLTPDDNYPEFEISPQEANGSIYNSSNNNFLIGTGSSYRVGDIIVITMDESIQAKDSTHNKTSKSSSNTAGLGFKGTIGPDPMSMDLDVKGASSFSGSGASSQSHSLKGNISVSVVKVYPNGNLAIAGKKTISLKNGTEAIAISGIIREADISTTDNTVPSNKIANSKIFYLGDGDNYDNSQKGWLTDIMSGPLWPL